MQQRATGWIQTQASAKNSVAVTQFRVCILRRPHQLRHNAARRLSQFKGSSRWAPQMLLLIPLFGGCTATIIRGLTYSKIFFERPKKVRFMGNPRYLIVGSSLRRLAVIFNGLNLNVSGHGTFNCIAQFRHKAMQRGHKNYIKIP